MVDLDFGRQLLVLFAQLEDPVSQAPKTGARRLKLGHIMARWAEVGPDKGSDLSHAPKTSCTNGMYSATAPATCMTCSKRFVRGGLGAEGRLRTHRSSKNAVKYRSGD